MIELTSEYWDCECDTDYIHPSPQDKCEICDTTREEQPDSRVNEVLEAGFEIEDRQLTNDEYNELKWLYSGYYSDTMILSPRELYKMTLLENKASEDQVSELLEKFGKSIDSEFN